jgi:hypothetical protein
MAGRRALIADLPWRRPLASALAAPAKQAWMGAAACTLVVAAIILLPLRNDPGTPYDEGLLLAEPERFLDGGLPHRDFETFYGPANTWLLGGVYVVTEPEVDVERAVGLAYRLAVIAGVFALAVPAGALVATVAAALSGLLMLQLQLLAAPWFAGLALALWSLWWLQRSLRGEQVDGGPLRLAGLMAGLAIAFRPQLAAAIGLAALPLLLGQPWSITRRLGLWLLVGSLPLLAHIALAGPAPVFKNLVTDALLRGAPESARLIPATARDALHFLLLAGGLAILVLAALVAWRRARGTRQARRLASLALLCVGLSPQALSILDAYHIDEVACVVIPLVPIALASPLILGPVRPSGKRLLAVGIAALTVAVTARVVINEPAPHWVRWESRSFPLPSQKAANQAHAALAKVDRITSPGDRLIVGVGPEELAAVGNDAYLYHLLPQLEPGTHHLMMANGTTDRAGSGLPREVAVADAVISGSAWHLWRQIRHRGFVSDASTRALRAHHCPRGRFGMYRVYGRCR